MSEIFFFFFKSIPITIVLTIFPVIDTIYIYIYVLHAIAFIIHREPVELLDRWVSPVVMEWTVYLAFQARKELEEKLENRYASYFFLKLSEKTYCMHLYRSHHI